MGFFSFLKYTFIIFAADLATSCGAPFENHCPREYIGRRMFWDRINSQDCACACICVCVRDRIHILAQLWGKERQESHNRTMK
jgi:hypothetical protein